MKDLCRQLDQVTYKYAKIVLVGNFNFHNDAFNSAISTSCSEFHRFIMERDLHILDSGPTRGESKLDLVFVSSHFTYSHIVVLSSIAGADHDIQFVSIPQWSDWSRIRWAQIDYLQLDNTLAQIDWSSFFSGCVSADEYAERFTNWLLTAIQMCTIRRQRFKKTRPPRHIIKLLHAKKKVWRLAKRSGSNAAYKEACYKSRVSIRQFKRNQEQRILYLKNSKQFFSYVSHKLGNNSCQIDLDMGGASVSGREAAEICVSEFSSNFSSTVCVDKAVYTPYLEQSKPI